MKRVKRRYDDALSSHSWQDLEQLLADYYRREGFEVEHCGTGATRNRYDGGIDLKLRRGDEYVLVECKHWKALQVPHNAVHQLIGVMVNEGATGAILVSSGEFTPYARESANKLSHVQLIDGEALRSMLGPLEMKSSSIEDVLDTWEPMVRRARSESRGGVQWGMAFVALLAVGLLLLTGSKLRNAIEYSVQPVVSKERPQAQASKGTPNPQRAGEPLNPLKTAGHILAIQGASLTGDQQAIESHMQAFQEDFRKSIKLADPSRRVDREAARAQARKVEGVRSAAWVDRENLLAFVSRNDQRSYETIDAICQALEPLGDTLGVVVSLQSAAARNGAELEILSRNCQLPPGERAFAQAKRSMNVLSAEDRATYEAGRSEMSMEDRKKQAESMKVLEANTRIVDW